MSDYLFFVKGLFLFRVFTYGDHTVNCPQWNCFDFADFCYRLYSDQLNDAETVFESMVSSSDFVSHLCKVEGLTWDTIQKEVSKLKQQRDR